MSCNYVEDVKDAILDWIADSYNEVDLNTWKGKREDFREFLDEHCICEDCITGVKSESFTCSAYEAEQNLNDNWDLLIDAIRNDEITIEDFKRGVEWLDVCLRWCVMSDAIEQALDELGIEEEGSDVA